MAKSKCNIKGTGIFHLFLKFIFFFSGGGGGGGGQGSPKFRGRGLFGPC